MTPQQSKGADVLNTSKEQVNSLPVDSGKEWELKAKEALAEQFMGDINPDTYKLLESFISQVEKDAINRLNHDHEILVNTILETKNKEIEDAIEKTNKRWESELYRIANEWDDELSELQGLPPHQHNPKMWSIVTNILSRMKSDPLEDKK